MCEKPEDTAAAAAAAAEWALPAVDWGPVKFVNDEPEILLDCKSFFIFVVVDNWLGPIGVDIWCNVLDGIWWCNVVDTGVIPLGNCDVTCGINWLKSWPLGVPYWHCVNDGSVCILPACLRNLARLLLNHTCILASVKPVLWASSSLAYTSGYWARKNADSNCSSWLFENVVLLRLCLRFNGTPGSLSVSESSPPHRPPEKYNFFLLNIFYIFNLFLFIFFILLHYSMII